MTFAQRLKTLREEKKLSQRELAKLIKMASSTLGMYETGKREPDFDTVSKIADFFHVSVDYLLGRKDPTPLDTQNETNKKAFCDAVKNDPELLEFWEDTKDREELKEMLKQAKKLGPAAIRQVVRFMKFVEDEEPKEDKKPVTER